MNARAAQLYRQVQLETSPARLLDGLYTRLLRELAATHQAIGARDLRRKAQSVDTILVIVGELLNALDRDASPELCDHLEGLYGFIRRQVLEASSKLDPAPLDAAERIVETLRASFREALGARL